jgi:hypothetical protein
MNSFRIRCLVDLISYKTPYIIPALHSENKQKIVCLKDTGTCKKYSKISLIQLKKAFVGAKKELL